MSADTASSAARSLGGSESALHLHTSSPLAAMLPGRRTGTSHSDRDGQHSRAASRKDSVDSAGSHSRATSPLRALMDHLPDLRRFRSREEPFVAIDPFRASLHWPGLRLFFSPGAHDHEHIGPDGQPIACGCVRVLHSPRFHALHTFALEVLPRHAYLHALLRLPSLYFTRVARLFEDADVSRPDIQRMIDMCNDPAPVRSDIEAHPPGGGAGRDPYFFYPDEWTVPAVSPALARFKRNWEIFIDQLLREWKTLNLVSALLLSAILTLFQIPAAAQDTVIRTPALLSLVCALMSLCFGCVYSVRFGTMRSMYRASRWAEEARASKTAVLWNVWVLLALPGVWLAWAMLAFCVAILGFVWRTGARPDPVDGAGRALDTPRMLGPRVAVTAVFAVGMVYFWAVIVTFARYSAGGPRRRGARREREREGIERGQDAERGRGRQRSAGSERRRAMGLGLSGVGGELEKEKTSPRVEENEVGLAGVGTGTGGRGRGRGRGSGSTSPYVA
jgi:hypothetical protein